MSLQDLTYLRTSGKVPTAVWVVVGNRPRTPIDGPDVVTINPKDDVRRMDFRPLIGLHVDVFENGDYPGLLELATAAIDAAKPKSTGIATRLGVSGVSEDHERILKRTWELLCN